jgi:hypothetical protein
MTTKAALFLLSALATACLAGTQDPKAQDPKKVPAGPPFAIEAGELKLGDLIDRAADYLKRNILVTEQEMMQAGQGSNVFKLQQPISTDRDGCEELLTTLLSTRGFAVVPLDEQKGVYEVISMNGPRSREIFSRAAQRTPEQILARPNLKMPVVTVVPLKHVNGTIATNALRPFFASTGAAQGGGSLTLGNVGNNSSILLSGLQDQVANAIRMLQIADIPGAPEVAGAAERMEALSQRVAALEQKIAGKEK